MQLPRFVSGTEWPYRHNPDLDEKAVFEPLSLYYSKDSVIGRQKQHSPFSESLMQIMYCSKLLWNIKNLPRAVIAAQRTGKEV